MVSLDCAKVESDYCALNCLQVLKGEGVRDLSSPCSGPGSDKVRDPVALTLTLALHIFHLTPNLLPLPPPPCAVPLLLPLNLILLSFIIDSGDCYCTRDAEMTPLVNECKLDPAMETVVASGMEGAACYRIPSILQNPTGKHLTLRNKGLQRLANFGDNGKNKIVLGRRKGVEIGSRFKLWVSGEKEKRVDQLNYLTPPIPPCSPVRWNCLLQRQPHDRL